MKIQMFYDGGVLHSEITLFGDANLTAVIELARNQGIHEIALVDGELSTLQQAIKGTSIGLVPVQATMSEKLFVAYEKMRVVNPKNKV